MHFSARTGLGRRRRSGVLATLQAPTSGTAFVGDVDVREQPLVARARIGFLAASMGLYQRLTPVELLPVLRAASLHGGAGPSMDEWPNSFTCSASPPL